MLPYDTQQTLTGIRSQIRIAIDALKAAKDQLINAELMPNTAEEITDIHAELIGIEMATHLAVEHTK